MAKIFGPMCVNFIQTSGFLETNSMQTQYL